MAARFGSVEGTRAFEGKANGLEAAAEEAWGAGGFLIRFRLNGRKTETAWSTDAAMAGDC